MCIFHLYSKNTVLFRWGKVQKLYKTMRKFADRLKFIPAPQDNALFVYCGHVGTQRRPSDKTVRPSLYVRTRLKKSLIWNISQEINLFFGQLCWLGQSVQENGRLIAPIVLHHKLIQAVWIQKPVPKISLYFINPSRYTSWNSNKCFIYHVFVGSNVRRIPLFWIVNIF